MASPETDSCWGRRLWSHLDQQSPFSANSVMSEPQWNSGPWAWDGSCAKSPSRVLSRKGEEAWQTIGRATCAPRRKDGAVSLVGAEPDSASTARYFFPGMYETALF